MNHDIKEQLNKIEKDLQEHKIESWRAEILDFANSCMNHRRHTKEEFNKMIFLLMKRQKGKVTKSVADMYFDRFFTCNAAFLAD